jgi:hypothetical protein
MTYKINGVELMLQPTTGRWLPRSLLGISGDGHPIYPTIREFELRWGMVSPAEENEIRTAFMSTQITGTLVVDLPKYASSTYEFYAYTGVVPYEPERNIYFTENISDFMLLLGSIIT